MIQTYFLSFFSKFTGNHDDFDMTRAITVFAPDENIAVKVDMAGSAGQSFNGNSGGEVW